jgi:hypothetical protein
MQDLMLDKSRAARTNATIDSRDESAIVGEVNV